MPCCWNAMLLKCHVVEMPCCWNAMLLKCLVVEMPFCISFIFSKWHCVEWLFVEMPIGKMPILKKVILLKCYVWNRRTKTVLKFCEFYTKQHVSWSLKNYTCKLNRWWLWAMSLLLQNSLAYERNLKHILKNIFEGTAAMIYIVRYYNNSVVMKPFFLRHGQNKLECLS